jgi:hypothetical protein
MFNENNSVTGIPYIDSQYGRFKQRWSSTVQNYSTGENVIPETERKYISILYPELYNINFTQKKFPELVCLSRLYAHEHLGLDSRYNLNLSSVKVNELAIFEDYKSSILHGKFREDISAEDIAVLGWDIDEYRALVDTTRGRKREARALTREDLTDFKKQHDGAAIGKNR